MHLVSPGIVFSPLTADGEMSTGVSKFGIMDLHTENDVGEEASTSVGVKGGVRLDGAGALTILALAGGLTAKEIPLSGLDGPPLGTID